jgi:hypothetical protein
MLKTVFKREVIITQVMNYIVPEVGGRRGDCMFELILEYKMVIIQVMDYIIPRVLGRGHLMFI